MQQLQLWTKEMRRNFLLYILIIFSLGKLFGQTITISIPNYLKMYADGIFTYQLEFDANGRLSCIRTDNKNNAECTIEYKSQTDIVLNYIALNRKKDLHLNKETLSQFNFTNPHTTTLIVQDQIEECFFKNSINYVINSKTKEVVCRYEYKQDPLGNYIISYATQMEYDSDLDLNWYSVWEDKIIVKNFFRQLPNNTDLNKNNLIILYTYNKVLAQILYPLYYSSSVGEYSFNTYTSSSFLTEGNIAYRADNLKDIAGLPWASNNGYGLGDKILINLDARSDLSFGFYNGFQSQEKSYLYELNSRAKRIKITCMQTKKMKLFDLKDTNKKQIISLNDIIDDYGENLDIELEIIDIYPGAKYKDLCIQAIVPET